ncbi:MAG: murein peptide amidase [Marmoricola sp.]|nr:murein peptide amidase [Marmoricola sp.]
MRPRGAVPLVALSLVAAGVVGPAASDAAPAPQAHARAVVSTKVFGTSAKGRDLKAFRLGVPTSKRKVVFIATMHGNEAGPAKVLLNLIEGSTIKDADIWVIPRLNVDGLLAHRRTNGRGVDLNRNFPVSWKRQTGTYNSGTKAASEPETKALMRFLAAIDPTYVVSFHQPLNGVDTSFGRTRKIGLRLAAGLHLPRKEFDCHGGCHGTFTQWFNATFKGVAITVEYGKHLSRKQETVTGPNGLLSSVFADR